MAKTLKHKKILHYSLIGLGLGVILILVLLNLNYFKTVTQRLTDIWKSEKLLNYFELYNQKSQPIYDESINQISTWFDKVVESFNNFKEKPIAEILENILLSLLDFGLNFIIYFCNYGLNIILISYICLHETFNATQLEIRTSPLTYLYLKVDSLSTKLRKSIIKGFKLIIKFLSKNRRTITLIILGILLGTGILYKILVESVIFIIVYVIRMINLETYLVVFSILKFLFTLIYPYLKYIPLWICIPILIILIFLKAISRANYKLKKNHERLKDFVKNDLTQTCFINGCPGTGKTLLNMSLSLACEENFIEELENKLLDYELQYKSINFAKIRANPNKYPEHKEYYELYDKLTNRGSYLISNYTIHSPYFDENSKSWDFEYMRKNINYQGKLYPLEEYIVISLSEFDKEYNSHDDKKAVGEDGVATFFSTVSHDLKRHCKIFVDYQLKDQVPLRIRGNAEYFITIKDRKRKYPILLYMYYLPIKIMLKINKGLIKKYELRKRSVERKSLRKSVAKYKRNDFTLIYVLLRTITNTLTKISKWFEHYYYFKLKTVISEEDTVKGKEKSLNINICDLAYHNNPLYDSTFLSFAYEKKKNGEFRNLYKNQSLRPTPDELHKCHSRFYDKLLGDDYNN